MSKKKEVEAKKKISESKNSIRTTQKQISSLEKVQKFLSIVEEKLVIDLDNQQINIPSQQIPLLTNDSEQQKRYQKQLKQVLHQKQQIRKKLKKIQNSQKLLQAGLNLSRARDKSLNTLRPKSELSGDDIQKLKRLKQQQLKFERELEQKTRQYKQKERLYKQQENQLIQKSKRQKNQIKKLQIEKKLQEMSQRKIERAHRFQQQKKTMRKLKNQTKLHEQLAAKWQNLERSNQETKRKNYEQRKKEMSVDLTQIKEHQKKYEQIIQKNREQINRKRLETSKISRKIFKNHLHHSRFYTLVLQEDQKKKSSVNEKKQYIMNLVQRKKQFSEAVKQNHIPKLKIKQSSQSEEKQQIKRIPLDFQQTRQKGLIYLKQAKNKANRNAFTEKNTQMNSFHEQKPKYIDYLTETRKKQSSSGAKTINLQRDYNIQVKEARNIMKKTNFSDQQKLDRVKLLAQRMETYDTKTTKSSVLLQKIQAKMQILQTIQ